MREPCPCPVSGHQRLHRLVQRTPHVRIAGLADAALHVDRCARLPAPGRQAEVGGDVARAAEARRILDRGHEVQRGDGADTGDLQEAPAQFSAGDGFHHHVVQRAIFLPQRRAGFQHRVHQFAGQRIVGHHFAHDGSELAARRARQLDPERLQREANDVFEVEELALEVAPVDQHPVAALTLDMRLPGPAGAHDMRQAERVGRVRLVALRFERRARMLGFQADRREAEAQHLGMQPRRQRARFVTDPAQAL